MHELRQERNVYSKTDPAERALEMTFANRAVPLGSGDQRNYWYKYVGSCRLGRQGFPEGRDSDLGTRWRVGEPRRRVKAFREHV
jgi:hypothetical protein